jgi:hypothetical protein
MTIRGWAQIVGDSVTRAAPSRKASVFPAGLITAAGPLQRQQFGEVASSQVKQPVGPRTVPDLADTPLG